MKGGNRTRLPRVAEGIREELAEVEPVFVRRRALAGRDQG